MYDGWRVVWALFVILTFTSGLGFYNQAILISSLADSGDFSIAQASNGVSLFFVVSGVSGLLVARLVERLDIRLIVGGGGLLGGAALAGLGQVTSLPSLYVCFTLFGIGFSLSGLVPATTLVTRWFTQERARALSVASTGLSIGGMLITPVSAMIVAKYPFADAMLLLGLTYTVGVLPVALFLRNAPIGNVAVSNAAVGGGGHSANSSLTGVTFALAVRGRFFWVLSLAYVFVMAAQVGGIAHQYGVVSERLDAADAAFAVAILPMFSVLGRLVGGFVLHRFATLGFTLVMMCLQALALLLIALAGEPWVLYASLALFGVTVGNLLMLQPLIVAEYFGLHHYGRIFAWSNLITQAGVASGPAVLGWLVAMQQGYQFPYMVAAASGLLATMLFATVRSMRPMAET